MKKDDANNVRPDDAALGVDEPRSRKLPANVELLSRLRRDKRVEAIP
jgi:hypothetical protein